MNTFDEEVFIKTICAQLDASIEQIDPALADRLHRIRQAALLPLNTGNAQDRIREELLHDVRDTLDRTASLSPDINAQLDSARRLAVAKMQRRNANYFQLLYSRIQYAMTSLLDASNFARPSQMIATACVLVTVVSLSYISSRPAGTLPLDDEIALIASAEDFELVENLEFYMWLAENGLPN